MIREFNSFIESDDLFTKRDRLLLACSGGIDSVVCFHLLHESGYSADLAHCNFGLRGEESDADEEFVRQLAVKAKVEYHTIRFETLDYARRKQISVQMAARDLRYQWFEEIRATHAYQYIIVAQHADDSTETMLINLIRGTGLAGLTGITSRSGKIRRPLLFATRSQISGYANNHQLVWREDSSNAKTDYMRNRIRHLIIPEFEKLNPSFSEVMNRNAENLRSEERVLNQHFDTLSRRIVTTQNESLLIDLVQLNLLEDPTWFLYRLLSPKGFTASQVSSIREMLPERTGKQFFSESHRLVFDRSSIFLIPLQKEETRQWEITFGTHLITEPLHLAMKIISRDGYEIPADPGTASFDLEMLEWPLRINLWKDGDRFQPLGMER